jgi:hypothetical protein
MNSIPVVAFVGQCALAQPIESARATGLGTRRLLKSFLLPQEAAHLTFGKCEIVRKEVYKAQGVALGWYD